MDANIPIVRDEVISTHGVRRFGSAALDLANVAAGRVEGYWELFMDWWDIAAGILLVEEAGGKTFIMYPKDSAQKSVPFEKPVLVIMSSNGNKNVHDGMKKIINDKIDSQIVP